MSPLLPATPGAPVGPGTPGVPPGPTSPLLPGGPVAPSSPYKVFFVRKENGIILISLRGFRKEKWNLAITTYIKKSHTVKTRKLWYSTVNMKHRNCTVYIDQLHLI